MKRSRALVAAGCGLLLAGLGLVPVRHRVTVEAHPGNPVTRVRVESRSLLAIQRPGRGLPWSAFPPGPMGLRASTCGRRTTLSCFRSVPGRASASL